MTTEYNEYYGLSIELAEYDLNSAIDFNMSLDDEEDFKAIDLATLFEDKMKEHALNMFTPQQHDWDLIPF